MKIMQKKKNIQSSLRILFFLFISIGITFSFCVFASFCMSADIQGESNNPAYCKHHEIAEMRCEDCHQISMPKALTTDECLLCHGNIEEVAEATEGLDPNPHNSPHYGPELDCELCHHEHAESENFCAQCHEWELRVP